MITQPIDRDIALKISKGELSKKDFLPEGIAKKK